MNPRDSTLPDLVFTTDDSERCRRSIKSKGLDTVESLDDWEPLAVRTWFLSEGGIDRGREVVLLEDILDRGAEDERNSSERTLASACGRDIADCTVKNVRGIAYDGSANEVEAADSDSKPYVTIKGNQGTGDRGQGISHGYSLSRLYQILCAQLL